MSFEIENLIFITFRTPKVFDHNNLKNSDSPNIENRNTNIEMVFDIENLIAGNVPNAKVVF